VELRESICHGAICRAQRKDGWQMLPKHIAAAIRRKEEAIRRQADEALPQEEAQEKAWRAATD